MLVLVTILNEQLCGRILYLFLIGLYLMEVLEINNGGVALLHHRMTFHLPVHELGLSCNNIIQFKTGKQTNA